MTIAGVAIGGGRTLGTAFPWRTMIINVFGCCVMGALVAVPAGLYMVRAFFA